MLHAAAFFIAGLFVVFTVANKSEPEFTSPPPVERPKMKLKKPKVKVKKSSNPRPSSRIVAKVKTKQMPEIQLPDLVGVGDGLMSGTGFGDGQLMDLPDFKSITLMGSTLSTGTDLIGTYYDLKRERNGSVTGFDMDSYYSEVRKFIDSDWDERILQKYYSLPQKMYASTIVVPVVHGSFAPVCFGDVNAAEGGEWLIHYKGKLVHKEAITFRFWAAADIYMVVRVDGKITVASVWDTDTNKNGWFSMVVGNAWTPRAPEHREYICGRGQKAAVGDWITLEPGVEKDIEIIIGDHTGNCAAYLMVQEEGVKYETSNQGGPILPAFRTAELSHDQLDVIYAFLAKEEMICMTNGPIFNDLSQAKAPQPDKTSDGEAAHSEQTERLDLHSWTLLDGRTFDAKLSDAVSFDSSIPLINTAGETVKVPYSQLSPADREFIDISRVPKLDVDILKSLKKVHFSSKLATKDSLVRQPELRASFGVRVKQVGSGSYDHELTAEFFAIGKQIFANRYLVLDRDSVSFKLNRDNDRRIDYVNNREYPLRDMYVGTYTRYGEKYFGYLVLVTDELGRVVAHEESNGWLFDHYEKILQLQIGNYLDNEGNRRYPIRPDPIDKKDW
jgi:hypothetical protein